MFGRAEAVGNSKSTRFTLHYFAAYFINKASHRKSPPSMQTVSKSMYWYETDSIIGSQRYICLREWFSRLKQQNNFYFQNSTLRPSPPTHPSSQPSPHSQPPPPHSQIMTSQPFMGPRYPAGPRPSVRMPQIGSDFNGVSTDYELFTSRWTSREGTFMIANVFLFFLWTKLFKAVTYTEVVNLRKTC